MKEERAPHFSFPSPLSTHRKREGGEKKKMMVDAKKGHHLFLLSLTAPSHTEKKERKKERKKEKEAMPLLEQALMEGWHPPLVTEDTIRKGKDIFEVILTCYCALLDIGALTLAEEMRDHAYHAHSYDEAYIVCMAYIVTDE